jgi:hypothetical protein
MVKHVFEDLRQTKAPNMGCRELEMVRGEAIAASACDVGAKCMACAHVVLADRRGPGISVRGRASEWRDADR